MNNKPTEKVSLIGSIIDLPLEDFKKELVSQRVTVGIALNLKLHLVSEFERCKLMSQDLAQSIAKGTLKEDDPDVSKAYTGLFVQMQKIENMVSCVSDYIHQITTGVENTFDTQKH